MDDSVRRRCKRYNEPGHAHLLTFSCYKRQSFLSSERTCVYLAKALEDSKEKHRFDLWGYVFMPEHAHLLVHPRDEEYSVSRFLESLKKSVARRAILHLRRDNPGGLKYLATG